MYQRLFPLQVRWTCTTLVVFLKEALVIPLEVNSGHMCAVKHFPSYAAAFWLPILVFEFFLFALAFRVAWYNHQQLGNWRGAALLHVVLRDNFNFFFLYVQFLFSPFQQFVQLIVRN